MSGADAAAVEDSRFANDRRYWILATMREAAFGMGDPAAADRFAQMAASLRPHPWMLKSTADQIARLAALLQPTGAVTVG